MSLKSCARRRPRTFARIMPKPPSNAATPRAAVELLARLTTLSQELAGAFRPATVVELVAAGRAVGAVSLASDRQGVLGEAELTLVTAVLAQAAIALENARLVELLSSARREWEKTVDAITQAICIVDAHGMVRRANRVFAELIQVPVTAIPGRPWIGLLPPAWSDPVARALAEPTATLIEIRHGDRSLSFTAIPMAEPGAAVLVFEDQTERRRLQEQLIQSEKMSAIGQLIAGVAHELNNPLASVVGFSDFLAEGGEIPPRLAEPLQVIRQEAERAATIVKNLLSFARSQEGERKLQPIGAILESTLALLRNQLMANKVEATLEVEPGLPDVEVDGNQIKQVFVNLINNANQAIASDAPSGRIWVAAKPQRAGAGVAVSITDSGPGMAEEIAAHVFEPFFTTKGEGEGTGLGLSICQGILKEHGGRITLDTQPGGGATFTAEPPRAAERIIFATGDTVRGDTLQFLESLGRPYLHKPFTLAELRAALSHAANQPA